VTQQRTTRQRTAILALLDEVSEFRSAQQLHGLLAARGQHVGIATVYRAVQALAESGKLDVLRSDDGEVLYRRCERDVHHHHLVCRTCGRTVEIDGPTVEAWAERQGRTYGFVQISHTVELFGTCRTCRA
jgi:Fur family transcriptional regulator, ferric uptake regulator